MPSTCHVDPGDSKKWRHQNVIDNPNIVSNYMHLRYTMFRDDIFHQLHHATDY